MKISKIHVLAGIMIMTLLLLQVEVPQRVNAAGRPVMMVLNAKAILIKPKQKQTLKVAFVAPAKASKSVKYEIANRKIATVSKKGVVKGKKIGVTTIRVTSKKNKKIKKLVKVIVAKELPKKVTLSAGSLKLKIGNKKTLKTTVTPKSVLKTNKKGYWNSSNSDVAEVTNKGVVKAVKEGKAVVTFKTMNGKKASCSITVISKEDTTKPISTETPAPEPAGSQEPTAAPVITAEPASGSSITSEPVSGPAITSGVVSEPASGPAVQETVSEQTDRDTLQGQGLWKRCLQNIKALVKRVGE